RYITKTRAKIEEQEKALGEKKFNEEENKFQLSEIMQALVVDLMNRDWFKNCKTIMTSDFDDLKNGFDAVMKRGEGYLGISIDFTVSNKENIIQGKLEKEWKRNIKDGNIPRVKYFEDPDTKQKGNLLVPKFIVGASKTDVETFAKAYLGNEVESLNDHPFKYIILLQMEEQLQTVLDYYENDEKINNKKFEFARRKYNDIQTILRSMKRDIHLDEEMRKKIDIFEYSKENIALNTMRKFRITRE
ncbi:MAG: hypothetical protein WCG28_04600, partial [bacterium]